MKMINTLVEYMSTLEGLSHFHSAYFFLRSKGEDATPQEQLLLKAMTEYIDALEAAIQDYEKTVRDAAKRPR